MTRIEGEWFVDGCTGSGVTNKNGRNDKNVTFVRATIDYLVGRLTRVMLKRDALQ